MSAGNRQLGPKSTFKLVLATAAAALLTGCADSSRMADPFSNPFASSASSQVDKNATGSIAPRSSTYNVPHQSLARNAKIETRDLPPLGAGSAAPRAMATAAAPMAVRPVAPVVPRGAGGAVNHWTAEGGTSIIAAEGDTAAGLATRYGVPTEALLQANGFSSASQVQTGTRLVVPVYRASGASSPATPVRAAAPATPTHNAQSAATRSPTQTATQTQRPEKYKLVKGPDPVKNAKASKAAEDEDDAAPISKAASKPEAKAAKPVQPAQKMAAKSTKDMKAAAKNTKVAAKADDDEADEKPAKVEPKHDAKAKLGKLKVAAKAEPVEDAAPVKKASKESAKQQLASQQSAKAQVAEASKPVAEKTAPVKVAEAKPAKAMEVDPTPTASLPPKEDSKASESANPEFRWPARGRIIQGFKSGGNDGINIAVPEGTAVKAAENGTVAYAGNELKGYGNLVLIRHPNGFVSAYAHNGELDVKRGDSVKRGQTIAKAGQSGNVSSPQVHFELRKGSTPVDPTNFLAGL